MANILLMEDEARGRVLSRDQDRHRCGLPF